MNFDMRKNLLGFPHSSRRRENADIGNEECRTENKISTIEKDHQELLCYVSSPQGVEKESPHEKMLTTLTGKSKCQRTTKDKAVKFSLKLMYVLTCGDYDHIVHWKTNKAADSALNDIFVIEDIDAFANEVLPSLFKMAKYESFQRKLYRWGFLKIYMRRTEKNKKRSISYTHPLFEKGNFDLAAQMTCSGLEDDPVPMCLNPMSITNPENCNFPTNERIEDCHSTAHNRRFTRSVQSVEQTFNGLSVDQILENAFERINNPSSGA